MTSPQTVIVNQFNTLLGRHYASLHGFFGTADRITTGWTSYLPDGLFYPVLYPVGVVIGGGPAMSTTQTAKPLTLGFTTLYNPYTASGWYAAAGTPGGQFCDLYGPYVLWTATGGSPSVTDLVSFSVGFYRTDLGYRWPWKSARFPAQQAGTITGTSIATLLPSLTSVNPFGGPMPFLNQGLTDYAAPGLAARSSRWGRGSDAPGDPPPGATPFNADVAGAPAFSGRAALVSYPPSVPWDMAVQVDELPAGMTFNLHFLYAAAFWPANAAVARWMIDGGFSTDAFTHQIQIPDHEHGRGTDMNIVAQNVVRLDDHGHPDDTLGKRIDHRGVRYSAGDPPQRTVRPERLTEQR